MVKRFVQYFPKDNPPHLVMSLTVDEVYLLRAFVSSFDACNPAAGYPFDDPITYKGSERFLPLAEALALEFTKALKQLGR